MWYFRLKWRIVRNVTKAANRALYMNTFRTVMLVMTSQSSGIKNHPASRMIRIGSKYNNKRRLRSWHASLMYSFRLSDTLTGGATGSTCEFVGKSISKLVTQAEWRNMGHSRCLNRFSALGFI